MANKEEPVSRRRLLKTAVQASALVAAPQIVPASALGRGGAVPPSDRVTLAGLGIGGRGARVLQSFLNEADVQFLAICDVRDERREAIKSMADQKYGNRDCVMYSDQYELWARKDIDAVLIATGDRWHALLSMLTAKSGKDVFCEKPCSMTIAESRALADTFQRLGRVYQAGTQRRSIGNFLFAADLCHTGKLGKLTTVHANTLDPATSHDWLPAEPEPPKEECDWDLWLGPTPWRPYNNKYVEGGWRGFFDFHGGGILEWGSHTVDLCNWAGTRDALMPVLFEPAPKGCVATYANGLRLVMRDDGWLGLGTCSVRYEGEEGWIETGDTGKVEVSSPAIRGDGEYTEAGTSAMSHVLDFLDAVKKRRPAHSNAEVVARSHIICHAAYIAWQLGRPLQFDPQKVEFIGDEQANRMRSRALRDPWRI